MKRRCQFNLRMTQEELDELSQFAGEGNRSEFIRKAIKWQIKTLKGLKIYQTAKKAK